MGILQSAVYIVFGFAGLIWSADKFVLGASTTARNLGVSKLVIGLTIVAFGTSAPEIFTSSAASLTGSPSIAIGNALGSNIANLGLVLAITILMYPIAIPMSLMRKEIPALLLVTGACFLIFADFRLDWIDGTLLLAILGVFVWRLSINRAVLAETHMLDSEHLINAEEVEDYIGEMSTMMATMLLLFGLVMMIVSSNVLVAGARNVALTLGVSELIIGLTIMAVGTSLPELATSITSAVKGHHDLVLGNIIGSNILNILLVLPVPAFVAPLQIEREVMFRDYLTMTLVTLVTAAFLLFRTHRGQKIGRPAGSVLLGIYLAYTAFLVWSQ